MEVIMHWTLIALIVLVVLAAVGLIVRLIEIKKSIARDTFVWREHPRDPFVIWNSTFYGRMRTRIGFLGGMFTVLGLGCWLPGWFSWLGSGLIGLLDWVGLALLVTGLLYMKIWPWKPAFFQIAAWDNSFSVDRADHQNIHSAGRSAMWSINSGGFSGDYEIPIHTAWAKIERRKFSYPGGDFGKKILLYARFYMARSGHPSYSGVKYDTDLPEELRVLL
jgi:hypothetical protein